MVSRCTILTSADVGIALASDLVQIVKFVAIVTCFTQMNAARVIAYRVAISTRAEIFLTSLALFMIEFVAS